MAGVAVVTDSTASLSQEQCAKAQVTVIPLQVVIDGVSRAEVDPLVSPAAVAEALRSGRLVTTSRPTPEAFAAAFADLADAGSTAIVSVHLSRGLSGTFEAASMARDAVSIPVTVVDTATLAMAAGFAVLAGAAVAAGGARADEVAEVVRARAAGATTYFSVDSLEYLRRGGRIGAAAALLGSALSVKPLLTVTGGAIRPYERVRTTARALARLEELGVAALVRAVDNHDQVDLAVHHLDNLSGATALAERLRGRVPIDGDVVIAEVSAVLGAHVGPGALGIVVSPRL